MPHIINTDTTKYQALFNQHIISYDEPSISEGVHIHDTFEYNHFNEILNDSIKMLKNNGYKFDPSIYYIELQRYNVNNKTKPRYDWHVDDDGPIKGNVISLIYYLRKDDTIKGGDLAFFRKKIKVNENMVITFKGNKYHRATDMSGYGVRDSIVVMFKRLN